MAASLQPSKAAAFVLAGAIIAAAASLRVAYIASDPPHGLSVSRAEYTDEGLKYYQARNRALFGRWMISTPFAVQGHLKASPVPNLVAAGVFKAFGAGRVEARVISVVAGIGSCLVLILIGVKNKSTPVGLLAGAFAATNFVALSYDRLALFESLTVFLSLCAVYFYLRGGRRRFVFVPLFLVLAYFTRVTSLAVVAAVLVSAGFETWRRVTWRQARKAAALAALASVLVCGVALLLWLLPAGQILGQLKARFSSAYFQTYPLAPAAGDLFVRVFPDSILAVWMPFTLVLALLSLSGALLARNEGPRTSPDALFSWWFLAVFAEVAFLDYRPTRYYVLLVPAACYLAARWLVAFASRRERLPAGAASAASWAVTRFFAAVAIAGIALRFLVDRRHDLLVAANLDTNALSRLEAFIESHFIGSNAVTGPQTPARILVETRAMWEHVERLSLLGLGILALAAAWMFVRKYLLPNGLPDLARMVVVVVLAFAVIVSQAGQALSFLGLRNRRYEVRAAERSIMALVGKRPDACIGGNWAPTLCMGTPYFTFPLARGNGNAWNTFQRFPVTHLVVELGSADEEFYLRRTYPADMARTKVLATYHVDFYRIALLEYSPPEGAPRPPWPFAPKGDK